MEKKRKFFESLRDRMNPKEPETQDSRVKLGLISGEPARVPSSGSDIVHKTSQKDPERYPREPERQPEKQPENLEEVHIMEKSIENDVDEMVLRPLKQDQIFEIVKELYLKD